MLRILGRSVRVEHCKNPSVPGEWVRRKSTDSAVCTLQSWLLINAARLSRKITVGRYLFQIPVVR